jgi:DNA-binding MarR family transcriptional regulator
MTAEREPHAEPTVEDLLEFLYRCPVGLVELGPGGDVRWINPAAVRLLAPAATGTELDDVGGLIRRLDPRLATAGGAAGVPPPARVLVDGPAPDETWIELRAIPSGPAQVMVAVVDVSREQRLQGQVDALGRRLREVVAATGAYRRAAASSLGISTAAAGVLEELLDRGPRTPGALARWLGLSTTAVTAVVDQLERRGLAARTPHPDDRRSVLVDLTADGRLRVQPLLDLLGGRIEDAVPATARDVGAVLDAATLALRGEPPAPAAGL